MSRLWVGAAGLARVAAVHPTTRRPGPAAENRPGPAVSGTGWRDPGLVSTSYSSSREIGGHGAEGVCYAARQDRARPGARAACPGHPAEDPGAEALVPGGRKSGGGRARPGEAEGGSPACWGLGLGGEADTALRHPGEEISGHELHYETAAPLGAWCGVSRHSQPVGAGLHLRMGPLKASHHGLRAGKIRGPRSHWVAWDSSDLPCLCSKEAGCPPPSDEEQRGGRCVTRALTLGRCSPAPGGVGGLGGRSPMSAADLLNDLGPVSLPLWVPNKPWRRGAQRRFSPSAGSSAS